jgi:osomolarity two-component system, response regulator SKN7
MHILYIEDNPKDQVLVERFLQTTDHHLTVVSRLEDIDLTGLQVDLVLLDIHFGAKTNGLDYLSQIRNLGIHCPVIAVTALTLPQQLESYYEAGIDRVVEKPFDITELGDAITYYEA